MAPPVAAPTNTGRIKPPGQLTPFRFLRPAQFRRRLLAVRGGNQRNVRQIRQPRPDTSEILPRPRAFTRHDASQLRRRRMSDWGETSLDARRHLTNHVSRRSFLDLCIRGRPWFSRQLGGRARFVWSLDSVRLKLHLRETIHGNSGRNERLPTIPQRRALCQRLINFHFRKIGF